MTRLIDDVPAVGRVGARRPSGYGWAGHIYEGKKWTPTLKAKYPDGVLIKSTGFPEFSPYVIEVSGQRLEIELAEGVLTGNRQADNAIANARVKETLGDDFTQPLNTVWHHVEDGRTMQLIPQTSMPSHTLEARQSSEMATHHLQAGHSEI